MSFRLADWMVVCCLDDLIECCLSFRLADWVAGAADREREKEERRQQRLEKRKAEAAGRQHKFADDKYTQQKDAVSTNLDDALTQVSR